MMHRIAAIAGLALISLALPFFLACGSGGNTIVGVGASGGSNNSTGMATDITISPSAATITVSGLQTFTAISKDSSGNTLSNVPLVWNSSNPAIATINSSGVATGVAVGSTNITASITYDSSGKPTTGSGTTFTSNMATLKVTTMSGVMGVVATGHALAGTVVTLKDAGGKSQTGMSDTQGRFQLSVAGMQGPFLVRADDGRGHSLFGAAAAEGVANVDTVTDLMLRAWYAGHGGTPEQAFDARGAHPMPDSKALQALNQAFGGLLHDALSMEGVDAGKFNLFSTPFTADSRGFDAVLDNTRAVTGHSLELQDGLMGRSTEIGPAAGGMHFTTHGAGMKDATQRVEMP